MTKIPVGTTVRYKGGVCPWSGKEPFGMNQYLERLAKVVDPADVPCSNSLMGYQDIDLCIEWIDEPKDASVSERYAFTSSTRVEVINGD